MVESRSIENAAHGQARASSIQSATDGGCRILTDSYLFQEFSSNDVNEVAPNQEDGA